MRRIILFSLLILLCFPAASFAHSGGTDASDGHNSPNGYHYHHGYPAHIHYHNICPYDVAEIAYDTEYPWEYDSFLDEYVDGFDCGYDIGAFHGEDDGYTEYHKNKDLFNPWTEYDDYDYPQESPYAYGYCDGYRFGYCIEFEETYNDEASYYDEYYEKYYDPEIEEVWLYANYKTANTSENKTLKSTELNDEPLDIFEIVLYAMDYGFVVLGVVSCIFGFIHFLNNKY